MPDSPPFGKVGTLKEKVELKGMEATNSSQGEVCQKEESLLVNKTGGEDLGKVTGMYM